MTWDQSRFTHALTAVADQSVTDISLPNLGVGAVQTGRIVRMIGEIQISATTAALSDLAVGVVVVSLDASQGVVPDPLTDAEQDWYYWRSGIVFAANTASASRLTTWQFDIRTSRRLRGGYRLVAISENDENPQSTSVHWNVRGLWTVP